MIKITNVMAVHYLATFNKTFTTIRANSSILSNKNKWPTHHSSDQQHFPLTQKKESQRLAVPQKRRCQRPRRSWRKAPWRWWSRECVPLGSRAPAACETPVWASDTAEAPGAAAAPTGWLPGSPRPPAVLRSPARLDSWPLRSAWVLDHSSSSRTPAWWRARRRRPSAVGSAVLN